MDEALHERIRAAVAAIPAGHVATYGDIAARAGAASPRLVGRVLAEDGADLPWHRVLLATGRTAGPRRTEQLGLLAAEGVPAREGRVDLAAYRLATYRLSRAGPPAAHQ